MPSDADPLSASADDTDLPGNAVDLDAQQEAPFDIADVPDLHVADDPVAQSDVLTSIQRDTRSQKRYTEQFFLLPRTPIPLSTHRTNYVATNSRSAINVLKGRSIVSIDADYKVDTTQDNVLMRFEEDFLDHILYLGNRIGIDAALPHSTIGHDHTWHVAITFSKMFKLWPDSKTALPFSTTGRMMYVGTRGQEELWLSFVPRSLVEQPNSQQDMVALRDPSTALTAPHAYMAVMFFSFCLSQMHFHDVYCAQRYPEPPILSNVRQVTDIL